MYLNGRLVDSEAIARDIFFYTINKDIFNTITVCFHRNSLRPIYEVSLKKISEYLL